MRCGKKVTAVTASALLALTLSACGGGDTETENAENAQSTASAEPQTEATAATEIDQNLAAGAESQRIVDILNAEEESSPADWEGKLHETFTEQVSISELVLTFNNQLRPAQPFEVESFTGAERQAVTVLTSEISDPMEMTVVLDTEGKITGLTFLPHTSEG